MIKSLVWRVLGTIDYYTKLSRLYGEGSDCILMYHSVGEQGRYGNVSTERLRTDLEYLSRNYDIVDLPAIAEQESDSRRVAITFDDGWDDFYSNAVPILKEFQVEATVFVVSKNLGSEYMMSHDQITDLIENHDNITIGNHTASHPHLSRIGDEEELNRQIVGSQHDLEDRYGITVDRFAYPSGDFNEHVVNIVSASHDIAVSTIPRVINDEYLGATGVNRYLLPRIPAHYHKNRVRWEMSDLASRIREVSSSTGLTSQ